MRLALVFEVVNVLSLVERTAQARLPLDVFRFVDAFAIASCLLCPLLQPNDNQSYSTCHAQRLSRRRHWRKLNRAGRKGTVPVPPVMEIKRSHASNFINLSYNIILYCIVPYCIALSVYSLLYYLYYIFLPKLLHKNVQERLAERNENSRRLR